MSCDSFLTIVLCYIKSRFTTCVVKRLFIYGLPGNYLEPGVLLKMAWMRFMSNLGVRS